jgi:hypothetical protein
MCKSIDQTVYSCNLGIDRMVKWTWNGWIVQSMSCKLMNWLPIVWGRGILWGLVDSDFRSKNLSLGRNYFLGSVLFLFTDLTFLALCVCSGFESPSSGRFTAVWDEEGLVGYCCTRLPGAENLAYSWRIFCTQECVWRWVRSEIEGRRRRRRRRGGKTRR